jgi:hypothetical protein
MKYIYPVLLSAFFLLSACNRQSYMAPGSVQGIMGDADTRWETKQTTDDDRKLIYSANLDLTVAEPDSALNHIISFAGDLDGYVNRTGSYGATIRVPANRLDEAISRISALGKVTRKNIVGEDVTEAYFDMGIRLDNAEKARQRYLELLAKAENVEETLLVERELERLTETIDLLKGKMNRLDQLEAYSSISVNLDRKAKLGPLGYIAKGAYSVVRWLFVRN